MAKEGCVTSGSKTERILQIVSAIIIPLLIAVATIFITIQQNDLNKANRANDLDIAQKQREQDLLLANQTREQDRELNTRQRQQEQFLADEQRQETLLDSYIGEISELLLSLNFTLKYTIREFIIRPQTLAVLRQLDARRKTNVILFLFESGLLTRGNNPISLVGATLDGLNLDIEEDSTFHGYLFYLALPGTSLVNASFRNRQLRFADFRYTQMRGASFEGAELLSAEFSMVNLRDAKFSKASLRGADFSFTDLTGCDLSDKQLHEEILTLADAILPDGVTRGQAPNIIVNGDAELGFMAGWYLTNRTNITVNKYQDQTNAKRGKWYFQVNHNGTQAYMWQRMNVLMYSNMIRQGGVQVVLSMEVKPFSAASTMHVKTFNSEREELQDVRVLTKFEVDGEFLYASGFLPCDRNTNVIEVAVKVSGGKLIDNIRVSIEHAGHSVD